MATVESSATFAAGDRVEIPSGMGGLFDVKLLRRQDDGNWQVRVDMPRNPDWHGYLIDDLRESVMRLPRIGSGPLAAAVARPRSA